MDRAQREAMRYWPTHESHGEPDYVTCRHGIIIALLDELESAERGVLALREALERIKRDVALHASADNDVCDCPTCKCWDIALEGLADTAAAGAAAETRIRADEREKCAKVADEAERAHRRDADKAADRDQYGVWSSSDGAAITAEKIAAALRAGPQT